MSNIRFIESTHRYLDESDEDLISVSKLTDRFKEKVNWDEIAKRSAIKKTKAGILTTKEDVLKKWADKRNIGTILHKMEEEELHKQSHPIFYEIPCEMINGITSNEYKNSIPINELKNNTVYPELMIYDMEHRVCGQSDKVIIVNNKIHIWDYKTDAEISFKAYTNKWVKPRMLLSPLSHLEDCNGNLYSIKMSFYMYMLWKANKGKLKTGDIILEHIMLERDIDNDNMPILKDGKPIILKRKQIKLPYRKKEVMDILKTLK